MSIQILPPQLANQIAAGEVVERPASVVKELVENCLDAGATRIDIEIEKGGAKLIRIRDNGCGIAEKELALSLARHATSKVASLDDLEAILSFGFRGEALASISSVSRLTITSRTEAQTEAWQAYAEGSQMAVKVIPAAHPVGTTIDVHDLFFNTPARRRFLKSDKTEFTHIDEWLKRIAMVRADIHFTLQHNGKMVRNYRPSKNEQQYLQRLAQVSSKEFAEQAIKVNCEHDGLKLTGYLQNPIQQDVPLTTHYFYVNGRLVRDRLVNHAVRQAFAELSPQEQPNYVLMLQLDPHQVDVNVHPAKHEVRFHQSRYVHDFILQALQSALSQLDGDKTALHWAENENHEFDDNIKASARVTNSEQFERGFSTTPPEMAAASYSQSRNQSTNQYAGGQQSWQSSRDSLNANAVKSYAQLLSSASGNDTQTNEQGIAEQSPQCSMPPLLQGEHWVLADSETLKLLPVKQVALITVKAEIQSKWATGLISQPLLMPVSVSGLAHWQEIIEKNTVLLKQLGIEVTIKLQQLIIKKVPSYLRDSQLAKIIPELLQWLEQEKPNQAALINWIASHSISGFISAPQVWKEYCQLSDELQQQAKLTALALPWQRWLDEQKESLSE
ncbi:MAG: DNA mismatch repair endonuclease MutL [Parashewanella sp.]